MNYNYNKHINFNAANKTIVSMIKSFFNPKAVLINNPSISITVPFEGAGRGLTATTPRAQVTVQISYYLASSTGEGTGSIVSQSLQNNNRVPARQYNALVNALTQTYETVLGQSVNVQLELVRQYRPYMDASILAQYLAINASKYGFNRMMNLLLNAVPFLNPSSLERHALSLDSLPNSDNGTINLGHISGITGIKVQLSGLLTSQRNRSRKSVYTASAGTFHNATGNDNSNMDGVNKTFVDYSFYTSKSRLGAFSVKV